MPIFAAIMTFDYGFEKNGFRFGWKDKDFRELYRLPSEINGRFYSAKKMNIIKIGKQEGYRICGKKLTLHQLESLTCLFSEKIILNEFRNKNLPF